MQKVRKNSLSPCYSTNNKQNLPIDNYNTPTGLSFKHLEEIRKKKVRQILFQNQCQQNTKQSSNKKKQQSKNDKSIDEYRSSLKSKEKQMGSLQSQVKTLNSTITLLKDQLSNQKNQNKVLCETNSEMKGKLHQKNFHIENMKKQKVKNQKQLSQFYDILPKLNQLELEQNKLFEENESLKKKNSVQTSLLKNIKSLLKAQNKNEAIRSVLELISAYY